MTAANNRKLATIIAHTTHYSGSYVYPGHSWSPEGFGFAFQTIHHTGREYDSAQDLQARVAWNKRLLEWMPTGSRVRFDYSLNNYREWGTWTKVRSGRWELTTHTVWEDWDQDDSEPVRLVA
jgi:hypothetical protein